MKHFHHQSSTSSQRLIGSLCNNTAGPFRGNQSITSMLSEDESTEDHTDPNSIYRQKYSKDLNFFLWAIDRFEHPIQFKMHLAYSKKPQYISDKQFQHSTVAYIQEKVNIPRSEIGMEIKRYTRKNQIKIFLTLSCSREQAKEVF